MTEDGMAARPADDDTDAEGSRRVAAFCGGIRPAFLCVAALAAARGSAPTSLAPELLLRLLGGGLRPGAGGAEDLSMVSSIRVGIGGVGVMANACF